MNKNMFYGVNGIIFENAKNLRNNSTNDEMILWVRLKEHFPFYKFRRQHPLSNYIADFYCHKLKHVLEVDGSVHFGEANQKLDKQRQKALENLGLTVLRFTNDQIKTSIEIVIKKINEFIKNSSIDNLQIKRTL